VAQGTRKWWFIGLAVVVVAAGGAFLLTHRGEKVRLLTGEITRGPLDATVSATGTVNPVVMVHVGSQVSGTVAHLYADYNSKVRAGQLLLELDPAIYQAQLAQSQANYEKARVTTADALRAYKRAQELFGQNYVSRADRDAAQTAYESATAGEKQAMAAVKLSKVNLDHCTISSPISGSVISRSVDVGQTVAASLQAPELFLIANDLTRMQVETSIDEADIGKLREGQAASFTVDAFPDQTFQGRVTTIRSQPITQQNVVTYTTVIEVPNPDLKLRPGMTANVSILVAHKDDVVKVPNSALRFHPSTEVLAKFGIKEDKRGARGGRGAAEAQGSRAEGSGQQAQAQAGAGRSGRQDSSAGRGAQMAGRGPGEAVAGEEGGGGGEGRMTPEMRKRVEAWRGRRGGRDSSEGGRTAVGGARGTGGWSGRSDGQSDGRSMGGHGGFGSRAGGRNSTPPARIYVEIAPGKLKLVTVRTGLSDGSATEVLSGDLKPGAKVAIGMLGTQSRQGQNSAPGMGMGGPPGGGQRR
jgi:HlyD family secretion protein